MIRGDVIALGRFTGYFENQLQSNMFSLRLNICMIKTEKNHICGISLHSFCSDFLFICDLNYHSHDVLYTEPVYRQ